MSETHDLRSIGLQFRIPGRYVGAHAYGNGHINDTYRAEYDGDLPARYIHQRINHQIFRDPPALMENIERILAHLQGKLRGAADPRRSVLTLIRARDGRAFHRDESGSYWRTYLFIENGRSYDVVENPGQALESAKAFGRFQKLLEDLPAPRLRVTIPDFHDTPKRFAAFERAAAGDAANRAKLARAEIEFALARKDDAGVLKDLHRRGDIPERIAHNDTKFNNVIIDTATQKALCVADLDTVMPGLVLHDFGDMVRTTTSPTAEDERDLSKVEMQLPMFDALVRGYLESADFLTKAELAHLAFSGKLITFETGLRFLTDFLCGDVYFKVRRDGQNLDRCRTQFKLVESIERQEDRMRRIVEDRRGLV